MSKSIYSLVLSDDVVEAVDRLALTEGLSRSAMVNLILAQRVAYTTPEMRSQAILDGIINAMTGVFMLEQPTNSSLMARTSLRYRYNPTIRYSVELGTANGRRTGELKVFYRSQNGGFIHNLTCFFEMWIALEQRYISSVISNDIICHISEGRFTRTLNLPEQDISDNQLGEAIAAYVDMFDNTLKLYFSQLPDTEKAMAACEEYYKSAIKKQALVI